MRGEGSVPQAHPRTRLLLLVVAAAAALFATGTSGAVRWERPGNVQPHVPGELIVRFAPGVTGRERAAVAAKHDATVEEALPLAGVVVVRVDPRNPIARAAAELAQERDVIYAQPNFRRQLAARAPNDPRFGELWGLNKIAAPAAWERSTGSDAVTVAVVDTGVAYDHPDLAANIWTNPREDIDGVDDDGNGLVDDVRGWDFVGPRRGEDNDPDDESGHGTHVAGTIGARGNNGVGVTGVNWSVKVMALRAGDDFGLADADIIQAFRYACDKGANVINGSFGGYGTTPPAALLDAVRACPSALFVFAAGNDGSDNDANPSYPCNFDLPNVLCVAASGPDDALPEWSNYGATEVDLAAPGVGILSTSSARTVLADSFDGPALTGWERGGTGGSWAQTTEASVSPPNSITDSPGAPHANSATAWIRRTSSVDLRGHASCFLEARVRSDFDWLDHVRAEASTDSVWDDQDILELWSGSTSGAFEWWIVSILHLDGEPSVRVGFALDTNASGPPADGAHLDDVAVRCYHGATPPTEYESWDGTSMATPHVAGAAALVWAHRPNASVADVRAALLAGVDTVPSLAGKVVTGGRLNVDRALGGGSPPPPPSVPVADFDGDGDTDVSVWRPEGGMWYAFGGLAEQWGQAGDVPVPGQYDADPATDIAVWRPEGAVWYVRGGAIRQWGDPTDVPVPGDYDGDGDTDFAVWRPSNGVWYVHGGPIQQWGERGDVPVPGQYDADPATEFAVWRPSSGVWYVHGGPIQQWGERGDVPVPGQYDADPATEFAVWRPSSGVWYVHGGPIQQWGERGDVPVPGDYDRDGDTDFAVWRPSSATWYVFGGPIRQWGDSTDKPLPPLPSVARLLFPTP